MIPRPLSMAVAALALAIAPGLAKADVVTFTGSGGYSYDPVTYSGSMSVTPGGATSATIQISLTNTTSAGDAVAFGYITGFGFNVPGTTTASGVSSDTDFKFLTGSLSSQQTNLQAGEFSYAFSTSSTQLHSVGSTEITKGLAAGQSATFTVTVTGANAGSLTAAAIAAATSPANAPFSVRFRSTNTSKYAGKVGDGDKVPFTYTVVPPTPPPSGAVPAPAGLVLGLIGAGCFLGRKIRRKPAAE